MILVPVSREKATGEATFEWEMGQPVPVSPPTVQELKITARKMKGPDGDLFSALLALRGALEAQDKLQLTKALDRLEKAERSREREVTSRQSPKFAESRAEFGKFIAPIVGLPPDESLKHWEGLRPGPRAKRDPYRRLSYEVSMRVMGSQIALWWQKKSFSPAIYCLDIETALYIHTFFLAPVSGVGFRICPYDSEQFFQDRPNQAYCCPAHREAHRVARFRDKQKRKSAENIREDGKKHGTQKTR